jgi:hypothetical protein
VPLQAWSGPEGSSKLRFPDFTTLAQDSGKVVSFTNRPPLPPGNTPGTHFYYRLSRPQGHSAICYIKHIFIVYILNAVWFNCECQHDDETAATPAVVHWQSAALVQASLQGTNMSNARSEPLTAALINIKFVRHITPCTLAISSPTFLRKFSAFLHGSRALTTTTTGGGQKVCPKLRKVFTSWHSDIFQTKWIFMRALATVTMELLSVAYLKHNVKL